MVDERIGDVSDVVLKQNSHLMSYMDCEGESRVIDTSESSHLVEGVVMFINKLLHHVAEAIVDGQELLHRRARKDTQERDEVRRIAASHDLPELVAQVDQAHQLVVVVAVAPAEANPADHVSHGHHDVPEGIEAPVGLHDVVKPFDQIETFLADVLFKCAGIL